VPSTASLSEVMAALWCSHSVRRSLPSACLQISCVCAIMTFVKLSPLWMSSIHFQEMGLMLKQAQKASTVLRTLVSFIFGFYLLGRVSWWWRVMTQGRALMAAIQDIAMVVGGVLATERHSMNDQEFVALKFDLFRHLMCCFVYAYPREGNQMSLLTEDLLIELGFLTAAEAKLLSESCFKRKMVLKWMAWWLSKYIHGDVERQWLLEKLCRLGNTSSEVAFGMTVRAPWTFEALLYTMIKLWTISVIFGESIPESTRSLALRVPIVIPLFNFAVFSSFYQILLHMLDSFRNPLGEHIDALNIETLFVETEATAWEYLTSPLPEELLEENKFMTGPDHISHIARQTAAWQSYGAAASPMSSEAAR